MRWGLDADHRAAFRLEQLEANTWRAGLDRALLGVTMADERQRLFGGAVPLDDMDSGDIDLAGRLAELSTGSTDAVSFLGGTRPVGAWATGLADIADDLHRDVRAGRLAAPAAAAAPRRPRRRGDDRRAGEPGGAEPGRRARPSRRPLAGSSDEGELPYRAPHDLHPRPDAVRPPPGGLPPRPRRRRLPPPCRAGRRRPHRGRPARRRQRRPHRGPPASPRRPPGGDGPTRSSPTPPGTSAPTSPGRRPSL